MTTVLIPLPNHDFDPSEAGVPWRTFRQRGHRVVFATPTGRTASADARMVSGEGLGIFAPLMKADRNGRSAYEDMRASEEFRHPMAYDDVVAEAFGGLVLPGGHAPGMREYLESTRLQCIVSGFFERQQPVAAICHGVLLPARSRRSDGRSVLHGRKTTALTKFMELTAWALTCLHLGNYYRTYPVTVEGEVRAALATSGDFIRGPISFIRDSPTDLDAGFTVRDGNYLSARWPGDAHRLAAEFTSMLAGH